MPPHDQLPWDPNTQCPDIAVVVALKEELRELWEVTDAPHPWPNSTFGAEDYLLSAPSDRGRPYRVIVFLMGDMTPPAATQAANRLLAYRPALAVSLGIACSLDGKDLRLCDVIVPDQVDGYDAKAKAVDDGNDEWKFERGGEVFRVTDDVVRLADELEFGARVAFDNWGKACAKDLEAMLEEQDRPIVDALRSGRKLRKTPSIVKGHLASGMTVAAAQAFRKWVLQGDRNLKALEMEAVGVLRAAHQRKVPVHTLVLRGISDLGDGDKKALDAIGDGALRKAAMRNATRLLWALMRTGRLPRAEDEDESTTSNNPPPIAAATETSSSKPPPDARLFQAPPLSHHLVARSELAEIKEALLRNDPLPRSLAIHGSGGIGKTQLAIQLAHDPEIQAAAPNGVLWATLGQEPDCLSIILSWIALIFPNGHQPRTLESGVPYLRALLARMSILLIIDNVWEREHLAHLLVASRQSLVIVTTRRTESIPPSIRSLHRLHVMSERESMQLFRAVYEARSSAREAISPLIAQQLIKAVGCLPLAVEIMAALCARGYSPEEALRHLRLHVSSSDQQHDETPPNVVDDVIRLSLDFIKKRSVSLWKKTLWLGITRQGAPLPLRAAATIWNVGHLEAQMALNHLSDDALVLRNGDHYEMHDVIHAVTTAIACSNEGLRTSPEDAHSSLVSRYRKDVPSKHWDRIRTDGYIEHNLVWHIARAKDLSTLSEVLQSTNSVSQNMWFAFCQKVSRLAGFAEDLQTARLLAGSPSVDNLKTRLQLSTISSSLNSLTLPIPWDVPGLLLRRGIISEHEVFLVASAIAATKRRTAAYLDLAISIQERRGMPPHMSASTLTEAVNKSLPLLIGDLETLPILCRFYSLSTVDNQRKIIIRCQDHIDMVIEQKLSAPWSSLLENAPGLAEDLCSKVLRRPPPHRRRTVWTISGALRFVPTVARGPWLRRGVQAWQAIARSNENRRANVAAADAGMEALVHMSEEDMSEEEQGLLLEDLLFSAHQAEIDQRDIEPFYHLLSTRQLLKLHQRLARASAVPAEHESESNADSFEELRGLLRTPGPLGANIIEKALEYLRRIEDIDESLVADVVYDLHSRSLFDLESRKLMLETPASYRVAVARCFFDKGNRDSPVLAMLSGSDDLSRGFDFEHELVAGIRSLTSEKHAELMRFCASCCGKEAWRSVISTVAHVGDIELRAATIFRLAPYASVPPSPDFFDHAVGPSHVLQQIQTLTELVSDLLEALDGDKLAAFIESAVALQAEWWIVESLSLVCRQLSQANDILHVVWSSRRLRNLDLRARLAGRAALRLLALDELGPAVETAWGITLERERARALKDLSVALADRGRYFDAELIALCIGWTEERCAAFLNLGLRLAETGNAEAAQKIVLPGEQWTQVIEAFLDSIMPWPSEMGERAPRRRLMDRDTTPASTGGAHGGMSANRDVEMALATALPSFRNRRQRTDREPRSEQVTSETIVAALFQVDGAQSYLDRLESGTRETFLREIQSIGPALAAVDGNLVDDVIESVRRVGGWWP